MSKMHRSWMIRLTGLLFSFLFFLVLTWPVFQIYLDKMQKRKAAFLHQAAVFAKSDYQQKRQENLKKVQHEIFLSMPLNADLKPVGPVTADLFLRPEIKSRLVGEADWYIVDDRGVLLFHLFPAGAEEVNQHRPMNHVKSVGNVIRGFSGFSLTAYRGLDGRRVSGAWIWDNHVRFGLIREEDGQHLERRGTAGKLKAKKDLKIWTAMEYAGFLFFNMMLAVFSYYLFQAWIFKNAS